jgi:hypothetical protein
MILKTLFTKKKLLHVSQCLGSLLVHGGVVVHNEQALLHYVYSHTLRHTRYICALLPLLP